jgi:hypothetical protein
LCSKNQCLPAISSLQPKKVIIMSTEPVETHILMLIMEEILEVLFKKELENIKEVLFQLKEDLDLDLPMFKVNLFIILAMAQAGIVTLCNIKFYISSN